MGKLKDVFKVDKPIIGMVHLRPLPGSPKYDPVNMGMDKIISIALEEAAMLEQAGFTEIKTYGDQSFAPVQGGENRIYFTARKRD